eukprot:COSAG05_NODE_1848_length_3967_cov_4.117632_3_plen_67_part_00
MQRFLDTSPIVGSRIHNIVAILAHALGGLREDDDLKACVLCFGVVHAATKLCICGTEHILVENYYG